MAPLLTPAWGICFFTRVTSRPRGPSVSASGLPLARLRWNWGSKFICSARPMILTHQTSFQTKTPDLKVQPPRSFPTCRWAGERFRVLPVRVAGLTGRCGSAGRALCLPAAESPGGPRRLALPVPPCSRDVSPSS